MLKHVLRHLGNPLGAIEKGFQEARARMVVVHTMLSDPLSVSTQEDERLAVREF